MRMFSSSCGTHLRISALFQSEPSGLETLRSVWFSGTGPIGLFCSDRLSQGSDHTLIVSPFHTAQPELLRMRCRPVRMRSRPVKKHTTFMTVFSYLLILNYKTFLYTSFMLQWLIKPASKFPSLFIGSWPWSIGEYISLYWKKLIIFYKI